MQRRTWLAGATAISASRVLGANERVRLGLIGCGGRGRYVGGFMKEVPGAEFVAVADVYETFAARAREWAGGGAETFKDFRRLLERKDVDAVLVATPDHWHIPAAVLACQAGKDVYVEKPVTHHVREGRKLIEAAQRTGRIVQAGTQHRSSPHFAECARIVQSGELGEVRFVRVWNYFNRFPEGIGRVPDSEPPAGLNWDFYCGPSPLRPFNPRRFGATFRQFWDYSGGMITDFGTHRFDTVHQIMGADAPLSVSASGGRFSMKDGGEMPDTLQATYEYPGFIMSYEMCELNSHGVGGRSAGMRYYNARGAADRPHGMAYYGTNGALFADRIGFEIYPDRDRIKRRQANVPEPTSLHARAFVECVRTRAKPPADAVTGHRATLIGHLGNIALKTGRKLKWDAGREVFPSDAEASKLLAREARKPWNLI
ncbi:MAG: Gfo/Idh/MocA family oxidoreductase [Acidobacteria bacterium]|nr:Gfo/Idh/MocA family oxidoreductase [Acidobacteriota bacterium]